MIAFAVMGTHGPQQPLASIVSPALHVDARKRTKGALARVALRPRSLTESPFTGPAVPLGERPGSSASDVRLMARKVRGLGRGGSGGRSF